MAPEDDQDWRLQAGLGSPPGMLEQLVMHLRDPKLVRDVRSQLDADVVLTHDGERLFAYAASRAALERARDAIAVALRERGIESQETISHWDGELDDWLQVEPPPTAGQAQAASERRREAAAPQTRTLVVDVGREIRTEFEQSMLIYADQIGVECKVIEHPHLLRTQVAFLLAGPKHKLDEFAAALSAEERATIRTERSVMLSPL
jgi:hypothetical protein